MGTKIVEASDTRIVVTTRAWNMLYFVLLWITSILACIWHLGQRDNEYAFLGIATYFLYVFVIRRIKYFNKVTLDKEAGSIIAKRPWGFTRRTYDLGGLEEIEYLYGDERFYRIPIMSFCFKDGSRVSLLELEWFYGRKNPPQAIFDRHYEIARFLGTQYKVLNINNRSLICEYDFSAWT